MLRKVSSSDNRFKEVTFGPGVNILVADRNLGALDTDSRNGAGKSSLIEVIHFLLGMSRLTGSVLAREALADSTFSLALDWPDVADVLIVSRSLSSRSQVTLRPNVASSVRPFPEIGEVPNAEWIELIARSLFGFPSDHIGIGARQLLSIYARRVSQHGFNEPVRTFAQQSAAEASANVAYSLGLNWRLASEYQDVAAREAISRKLKAAAKDPVLGRLFGSVAELRAQVASASSRVAELEAEVAEFRVVPQFEALQHRADEVDRTIRDSRVLEAADRRNLLELEAAIRDEVEPSTEYLDRAFQELEIVIPDAIRRTYEDAEAFHNAVLTNRRGYLNAEMQATRERLEHTLAVREQLGSELSGLLTTLSEGGALESLIELQRALGLARAELQRLASLFDNAQALEATKSEIKFQRSRIQLELTQDIFEREAIVSTAADLFQKYAHALYSEDRPAYIDFSPLKTSLRIRPHIGGEDSQGIGKMVIFCLDLTIAVIAHRAGRGPDFLLHDSHLFDGVDERQISNAIQLMRSVTEEEGMQYILTINSDDLAKASRIDASAGELVIEPRLTDDHETGGLFGFAFD